MTIEFNARFVDKNHTSVQLSVPATLGDNTVLVPIRMKVHGITFELRTVNPDGTLVYHQTLK